MGDERISPPQWAPVKPKLQAPAQRIEKERTLTCLFALYLWSLAFWPPGCSGRPATKGPLVALIKRSRLRDMGHDGRLDRWNAGSAGNFAAPSPSRCGSVLLICRLSASFCMHGVPAASLQVCRPAKPASARCAIPWKQKLRPRECAPGVPRCLDAQALTGHEQQATISA